MHKKTNSFHPENRNIGNVLSNKININEYKFYFEI